MTRQDFNQVRKYLNIVYQELKRPVVIGEELQVRSFKILKKAIKFYRRENQTEGGESLKG